MTIQTPSFALAVEDVFPPQEPSLLHSEDSIGCNLLSV